MENKHACKYEQKKISATGQLPLPNKNKIDLKTLKLQIDEDANYIQASNGNPTYLSIAINILGKKNCFNIFQNGKVVCWHTISPKAMRYFLDYFYYVYVINSLSDTT